MATLMNLSGKRFGRWTVSMQKSSEGLALGGDVGAFAEVRKVVPPKVKITDAANGLITISTTKKTTLGKYELEVNAKGHAPIVMNIEVTDKNP